MAQPTTPPVFSVPDNAEHERISALFLGPKAENADLLTNCFNLIVQRQAQGRQAYFPDDQAFITESIQSSAVFQKQKEDIYNALDQLLQGLDKHSIPFYSPRYSAHMSVDQSLPAILGYLSTMFYNPNNVAFEASPFTTLLELEVGRQLCEMLGYNVDNTVTYQPLGWGHITCDGTVANLESVWASRNIKFYALSLRDAMATGKELNFIADSFKVQTSVGDMKLLTDLDTWDLLNLAVPTVLEIPERLYDEYGISSKFLDDVMKNYIIQSISKDTLMSKWGITTQPVMFVPSTKHYSWPKSAAIAGLGSDNCKNVAVDRDARMKIDELRNQLQDCLDNKIAVYEVVAVMGTTEEGAVDRISEIIAVRDEFKAKGLSFVVHADAAWGGYFASMIPNELYGTPDQRDLPDYVPQVGLRDDTATELRAMMNADSITIDPHKAGYVPYPAGSLCYRDGRMRYLLTWTAPYINQGTDGESIGVYGVEGSKPGAAAAAVYLSHQVIGLGVDGMGSLLGEASFTCRRFASHWAAMSDDTTDFIVVPMNLLPSELASDSTPEKVAAEKKYIRDNILPKENYELVDDQDAMTLLNKLGSDLNINAFACNFRYPDGTVNKDIEEANWLNRRIFETLSVTSATEDPLQIPFYITSTTFAQSDYGECADVFKQRLGLEGKQDLFVLRNVVMSPFTTTRDFVADMAAVFKDVLEREVQNVIARNTPKPDIHTFLLQGTQKLYFVHQPSFHMASGRRQFIFSADAPSDVLTQFQTLKALSTSPAFMKNVNPVLIDDITDGYSFDAQIYIENQDPISVTLSIVSVVKKRSLDSEDLESSYPTLMPFYLYGQSTEMHIEHALLIAPNIQLSAGQISATFKDTISDADLAKGLIAIASNVHEQAMQPFPSNASINQDKFFFGVGKVLNVTVYRDPFPATTLDPISVDNLTDVVTTGTLTIQGDIYIDNDRLNSEGEIPTQAPFLFTPSGQMTTAAVKTWTAAVKDFHPKVGQYQWSF